jgi:hypothetical protein
MNDKSDRSPPAQKPNVAVKWRSFRRSGCWNTEHDVRPFRNQASFVQFFDDQLLTAVSSSMHRMLIIGSVPCYIETSKILR